MSQAEIMLENRQNVIDQSIALFKKNGVEAYKKYQEENRPLKTGRGLL